MPEHELTSPALQRIWGNPDTILLVFAGGAAEFATIKAVDWLFFTNALPADPLGRFFQTVRFAQRICLSPPAQAAAAVTAINRIHQQVEAARGDVIPGWAYRDVLFLLIDYGERAHTIVFGPLSPAERQAHFDAFLAVGQAMDLQDLPATYAAYRAQRHRQLLQDYAHSSLTERLNAAYRTALGPWRFWLLRRLQASLIPDELLPVAGLRPHWLMAAALRAYRYLPGGGNKLRWLHGFLFPPHAAAQLRHLTYTPPGSSLG
jgi:uncharacterized protein (DUF2236 family)